MKKTLLVFLICLLSVNSIKVYAAECTNEEKAKLKKEAARIKLVYEEATGVMDPDDYTLIEDMVGPTPEEMSYSYFIISVNNIEKYFDVQISNNIDDEYTYIPYGMTNKGRYSFDWNHMDKIVKLKMEVKANSNSNCYGDDIAILYLTVPKYNPLADSMYCFDVQGLPACKKYITEDLTQDELLEQIEQYHDARNKKNIVNKKWYQKIFDFIKKHKTASIAVVIVGSGVGVTLVIYKRRKRVN